MHRDSQENQRGLEESVFTDNFRCGNSRCTFTPHSDSFNPKVCKARD